MLEKVCRNCGSTDVDIIAQGCDLDPFLTYRVYGLRTAGRTTSTRLRAGRALRLADRMLFGALSHLAQTCIDAQVKSWAVTDAVICRACEFYSVYHPFTDSMLASMYVDYRSETYLRDWEEFHPGYIEGVGRHIGGVEEADRRVAAMDTYLTAMAAAGRLSLDGVDSVLDWGGSDGRMLPNVFANSDRYVHDISDVRPVEGVCKLVQLDADAQFDYIQLTHVLEHVFSPLRFLEAPLAHLRAGGILYLEVPLSCEADGLIPRVLSGKRRLWAHEHINLYTPSSLRAVAEASGLRVLDLTTEIVDFHWTQGPCLRLLATSAAAP